MEGSIQWLLVSALFFFLFFGEKTTRLGLWKIVTDKYGHHMLLRAKYKGNDIL